MTHIDILVGPLGHLSVDLTSLRGQVRRLKRADLVHNLASLLSHLGLL